jgi:hypothetical protein
VKQISKASTTEPQDTEPNHVIVRRKTLGIVLWTFPVDVNASPIKSFQHCTYALAIIKASANKL